jgi:hypothetical protein
MTTTCGTPGYVAPEILEQKGGYGCEVDLWSLGVILYILICGFPPFYDENNAALYNQIKRGDYSFPSPYWDNVSKPAIDIVKKLLTVDPKARLTVQQTLDHPWIKGRNEHSTVNLAGAQEQLKKFNARRKFKNAVNTVMAVGFALDRPGCLVSRPASPRVLFLSAPLVVPSPRMVMGRHVWLRQELLLSVAIALLCHRACAVMRCVYHALRFGLARLLPRPPASASACFRVRLVPRPPGSASARFASRRCGPAARGCFSCFFAPFLYLPCFSLLPNSPSLLLPALQLPLSLLCLIVVSQCSCACGSMARSSRRLIACA